MASISKVKKTRNKRKFRGDSSPSLSVSPPSGFEYLLSPSLESECSSNDYEESDELHEDKIKLDLGMSCLEIGNRVELKRNDDDIDWSDLTESELERILLDNLDDMLKNVVKKVVSHGYSEEDVTKAVLRCGFCYGCKDVFANIVENCLNFLENRREVDSCEFRNLEEMEKCILAELVCVICEAKPVFSTGDAMWSLLISDMDVSNALCDEVSNVCFSKSVETQLKKDVKSSDSLSSNNHENKPVGIRNINYVSNRDYIPRQKSVRVEKRNRTRGSKGARRAAKVGNFNGLIFDKKLKSVSQSTSISFKTNSLIINNIDAKTNNTSFSACTNNPPKLSGAEKEFHLSLLEKFDYEPLPGAPKLSLSSITDETSFREWAPQGETDETIPNSNPKLSGAETEFHLSLLEKFDYEPSPKAPNLDFSTMPSENSFLRWIPQDKKDEIITTLGLRVGELESQLQEWNEWANQKVMQAACRLCKDKTELKILRKEKEDVERLKRDKHNLEQSTIKKLNEMEKALLKASNQVERADGTVCKLKTENANLRLEMEAARLQAAQSAASCVQVSERAKNTQMQLQLWEKQKTSFQEELINEKRKVGQLQEDLKRAKEQRDELETKWKQEEKAKQDLINQAIQIRIERQEGDIKAKSRDDLARLKADKTLQKYKDDIQKLKKEIYLYKLKSDFSELAALKRGMDGSYASKLTDVKISSSQQTQTHYLPKMVTGNGGVKRERECVMCLSEEKSVLFLPCAHQVVCTKCNELHEKQGMKECPSCRGPIQHRVCVRYARS